MPDPVVATRLPDNAYRELNPGETYEPMVPSRAIVPEVTARSIVFGIVMNIVFAMAATYLALKAGQGIETAIPISILSVGLSGFLARLGSRRSSLLENINILAIGTTSGIVAGGTCFTMPAIYMLGLNEKLHLSTVQLFLVIFLVPFLGAVLGVLFLVPFRRYFVRDMHGKLPFPEGTATNEILATGAAGGGGQAFVLIYSFIIAMAYNFASVAMRLFTGTFTTGKLAVKLGDTDIETLAIPLFDRLTNQVKAVLDMGTAAFYVGLGYIIGLRYTTIICCGSFLSCFALVPLFADFDLATLQKLNPAIPDTSSESIFKYIPRIIGIGGIFTAGLLSILKMSKVIFTALREALGSLFRGGRAAGPRERTDEDLSYGVLMLIGLLVTAALFLYFRFVLMTGMPGALKLSLVATGLALLLSFLFTTVSAWAIAMISTTPLSGMTVTTIIITAVVMIKAGLPRGDQAMLAVLLVGGVVCTALSMAGTLVTEFKIAYWLGATPKRIQSTAIMASLLGSIFVTGTIMVLSYKPGFVKKSVETTTSASAEATSQMAGSSRDDEVLSAPQANMMKSTLETFVGTEQRVPWVLYGAGAVVSVIFLFLGISPLAFALGMYLPMYVNTPLLFGAIVAHLLSKSSRDEKRVKGRNDKGILIASGLIAGAAIVDVLINGLAILDEQKFDNRIMPALDKSAWLRTFFSDDLAFARAQNWLGLIMVAVLALFVYLDAMRAKPAEGSAPAISH